MTTLGASVPYFSQWASTDRVPEILAGTFDLKEDPLGANLAQRHKASMQNGQTTFVVWPA